MSWTVVDGGRPFSIANALSQITEGTRLQIDGNLLLDRRNSNDTISIMTQALQQSSATEVCIIFRSIATHAWELYSLDQWKEFFDVLPSDFEIWAQSDYMSVLDELLKVSRCSRLHILFRYVATHKILEVIAANIDNGQLSELHLILDTRFVIATRILAQRLNADHNCLTKLTIETISCLPTATKQISHLSLSLRRILLRSQKLETLILDTYTRPWVGRKALTELVGKKEFIKAVRSNYCIQEIKFRKSRSRLGQRELLTVNEGLEDNIMWQKIEKTLKKNKEGRTINTDVGEITELIGKMPLENLLHEVSNEYPDQVLCELSIQMAKLLIN